MRNFILDTCILMAYLKADKSLIERISIDNLLNEDDSFIMISSVSKGEILALALRNGWKERKTETLIKLLNQLVIIDITGNNDILHNAYAEIDAFSSSKHPTRKLTGSARTMGKNDIWIAATAFATKATLLTTDQDFNHLNSKFIDVKYYHPENKAEDK